MARPWSAGCYGVARQREGSRHNGIGQAGSRDVITYECSQCGATTSRFGE
jgi:hypothetical protein